MPSFAFGSVPSDVDNWANVKGYLFGTNDLWWFVYSHSPCVDARQFLTNPFVTHQICWRMFVWHLFGICVCGLTYPDSRCVNESTLRRALASIIFLHQTLSLPALPRRTPNTHQLISPSSWRSSILSFLISWLSFLHYLTPLVLSQHQMSRIAKFELLDNPFNIPDLIFLVNFCQPNLIFSFNV